MTRNWIATASRPGSRKRNSSRGLLVATPHVRVMGAADDRFKPAPHPGWGTGRRECAPALREAHRIR